MRVAPSRPAAGLRADRGRGRRPLPLRRRRRELDAGQRLARPAPARLVLHLPDRRSRATPTSSGSRRCRCSRPSTAASTCAPVKGGGWDYHDVWIDPIDPRRMIVGSDAGVSLSSDGGETWFRPPLPIAQLYHVDDRHPRALPRRSARCRTGARCRGRATACTAAACCSPTGTASAAARPGTWSADPGDPRRRLRRRVPRLHHALRRAHRHRADGRHLPRQRLAATAPATSRYRFQWTAPILVSPHDPKTVYHAGNVLFRTADGGQHWQAISPDLTRDDQEQAEVVGRPDHRRQHRRRVLRHHLRPRRVAAATAGVLWAGSDDGLVHVTRDGGADLDRR